MDLRRRGAVRIALLSFFLLVVVRSAFSQEDRLAGLDAYIEKAMKDWQLPGLAIAVVKDDKVVLAKGYGVREMGKPEPVDENTIFAIGSNSKAFTATALGMLVQEKKISWDDHVIDRMKGFQLYSPYVTCEMTIRDLLCHRSGLKAYDGDFLWYAADLSRDEVVRRARYLKPISGFRSEFAYQNIMYIAAGQVIPAVTGISWDDFVTTRILQPLGMKRSNTSVRELKGLENVASPHTVINHKVRVIPYHLADTAGPAGSINSCVTDMVQWLRLQLGDGTYAGKTIVDKAVMEETHTPHTPMPLSAEIRKKCPSAHLAAYALAWVVQDYQGRLFLWHTGAIDGMRSMVGFVPEERLGLVVLTNCDNQALHTAVFHRALDTFLGTPPQDWSAMAMEEQKKDEALLAEELRKIKEARAAGTHPTLPLSAYTGNFEDDLYGRIKLTQEGDHLVLQYGAHLVGDLAHWHYDTFRLTWRDEAADSKIAPDSDQGAALVPFTLDALGKVTGFSLGDMADFKRVPEPKEASQK